MIDRAARATASRVLRQYREATITNLALDEAWPESHDRALRAIGGMLWNYYDDFKEHRISAEPPGGGMVLDLIDRCIAFLESDLEYEWAQDQFIRRAGAGGLLNLLTAGRMNRRVKRDNDQFWSALRADKDFEVWPFRRRDDYLQGIAQETPT